MSSTRGSAGNAGAAVSVGTAVNTGPCIGGLECTRGSLVARPRVEGCAVIVDLTFVGTDAVEPLSASRALALVVPLLA